jgi:Tol biopolymer transport system component
MIKKLILHVLFSGSFLLMGTTALLSIVRTRGESEVFFLAVASRDVNLTIQRFTVQGRSEILYHQPIYNPVDMAWSPEGRDLLLTMYHHFDSEGGRLVVVDAAGLGNHQIFSMPQSHSPAVWSPDGEEIAVIGAIASNKPLTLYRLQADGYVLDQFALPDAQTIERLEWIDKHAVRITYLTVHNRRYTIRLDLNTGDTFPQPDEPRVRGIPSPDGQWVVALEKKDSEYALVRTRPDGSEPLVLTEQAFAPAWADWSPDSEWISFTDLNAAIPADVYRVRVDGSTVQQLTDNNRNNATLVPLSFMSQPWSPNGRWRVVFSQEGRGAPWELWLLDTETNTETYLMDVLFEVRAEWSPPVDLPLHGWWLGVLGIVMVAGAILTSRWT